VPYGSESLEKRRQFRRQPPRWSTAVSQHIGRRSLARPQRQRLCRLNAIRYADGSLRLAHPNRSKDSHAPTRNVRHRKSFRRFCAGHGRRVQFNGSRGASVAAGRLRPWADVERVSPGAVQWQPRRGGRMGAAGQVHLMRADGFSIAPPRNRGTG
jgi:hypothetical protein